MINSLHKKIVLVLVLTAQIIKPMEQKPSACDLLGSNAVACGLGVFSGSAVVMANLYKTKELVDIDKLFIRGAIRSGLGFAALFMKSLNGKEIVNCGYDCNVVIANGVIFFAIVASLINQTAFIYKKCIDQLRRENKPEGKVVWDLCKQVDCGDLLSYVVGVGLLSLFLGK